jgi:raffinose/stachyose/melibiose transport system permease protein
MNALTAARVLLDERTSARRRWRRPAAARLLAYGVLLVLAILYIGPLLMLVNTALKTQPEFAKNPVGLTTTFTFGNFGEAWQKASIPQYLANSVFYTVVATVVYVLSVLPLSVAIARRHVRGWNLLYILFVLALFLPIALIPQFQLILHLGLYNNQIGYILLFLTNPVGVLILVAYIRSIPRDLDEAAALDGAGYVRYVFRIVLPLAKPALATVAILHAIGIWNDLIVATIYLTNKAYYPMTRGLIVFTGIYGNNWPLLAAAVLMLAVPMVVLFLFLQRYIISGFTAGSLRG